MHISIMGANRGVGFQLLTQALEVGHTVTALVRDPRKLTAEHQNLNVVKGDIRDPESVERATTGQDAICSCIGIGPTRKPVTVFSEGTQNVLRAMHKTGVNFLVCVTGIGTGDSRNHGGFLYDKLFKPLVLKTVYEDKDRQETLLKESDVDWIIVRPGFLTNGPKRGRYQAITDLTGVKAGKISRADVAHFILVQLASPTFLRQTPLLMY
jgi:putative NADH-flavin reductase